MAGAKTGRLAASTLFLMALALEAMAENVPQVPGDEIFGFTTATDVGNSGETGFANENDGRLGKRGGRYRGLNEKFELGHTFAPDWWVGFSALATYNFVRDVPDLTDVNRLAFDGLSFELMHRIVKRSQTNPFAVAVAMEARGGQIDGVSGRPSQSVTLAFKLFTDAVVVPEKLYWGANLIWAPQRAENVNDRGTWLSSSLLLMSSAISYQMSEKLFVGAEARYLAAYNTILPGSNIGHAVFAGPTLWWKVSDRIGFNMTLQPQITGRSVMNPGLRLDLDNFERAHFRAKVAIAFQ
jgi:hypothetical protein